MQCKNCESPKCVKSGYARGKQRYKCKECRYLFINGDRRTPKYYEVKKSISTILYSMGKASYGFIGKLFGVSRTTAYNWIKKVSSEIEYPSISEDIKEIEFDEMWDFIQSKKTRNGLLKHWIVAELLPGLLGIVMLKPSKDFITR